MINAIDYSNQNGLVDFNNTYTGNSPSSHNINQSNKHNFFYSHQSNLNLAQQQQSQQHLQNHHNSLLYQQQQQQHHQDQVNQSSLDFNNSQHCVNQYPFYTQQANHLQTNSHSNILPIHNHNNSALEQQYISLTPQNLSNKESTSHVNNTLNNSTNNFTNQQFDYNKSPETVKKPTSFTPIRSNSLSGLSNYDSIIPEALLGKKHMSLEEDEEEEDDDDDDEEFDEDEDFDEDEPEEPNYKKSPSKRVSKKDIDIENDYEIKHNCLTEEGAYMNTLFNSPSSLSNSSNAETKSKSMNGSFQYNNDIIRHSNVIGNDSNGQGLDLKNIKNMFCNLKTEWPEEHEYKTVKSLSNGEFSSHQSFSSASSSSSLSNFNEPLKINNQHMSQMISSYNKAGIMNDHDLVNLPLRELNKRLRSLPKSMAYNMKKRRRTLKNRKYAQNCRSKRLEQKSEMEIQNSQLKVEINRLNKTLEKLKNENLTLRNCLNKNVNGHPQGANTDNQRCLKEDKPENSLDDTKENKSFMISSTSNTSTNNDINAQFSNILTSPLTPSTPTYNINSQLTHLLSLPSIKTTDPSSISNSVHLFNSSSQLQQSLGFNAKC